MIDAHFLNDTLIRLYLLNLVGTLAESHKELDRLRRALEAVSQDLDAIERRPHLSLRLSAEELAGQSVRGIESFVDHFAYALKRGSFH